MIVTLLLMTLSPLLSLSTASAHVALEPTTAPKGSYAKLTFRVLHGCEGAATTGITVQIPEDVVSVKPQVHPGWEISVKNRQLKKPVVIHGKEISQSVSEISWSGGTLPDEFMDEFGMSLKLPEKADSSLPFIVIQKCKDKTVRWDMVPKAGQEAHSLALPAPMLRLSSGSGHSHH